MASYLWTSLTPGQNLGAFATTDTIDFTGTGASPSDFSFITWDGAGNVTISTQGKQVFFNIAGGGRALADTNFLFTNPNAGKLLIGDNTSDTSADDNGNSIVGSAGNDRIFGLGGDDTMDGQAGDDVFILGNGAGAWGNDSVIGGANFGSGDFIAMGSDASSAVIDFGTHTVSSAHGTASFSGIENAAGGSGDDEIWAFEASRLYTGRTYNPVGAADFTRIMEGFGGNDLFVGDLRDGLNDRVRYLNSPNGVYVNLAEETATDGYDQDTVTGGVQAFTDTLKFIDDIQASNFNDTLLGGGLGTSGGGFYNEQFEGMAGNDLIDGNGGANISFAYFSSPNGVVVDLSTGIAQDGFDSNSTLGGVQSYIDTLIGGTVSSNISGSNFGDRLTGDDTRTFLQGRGGDDTLDGRGGLDTAIFFYFTGAGPTGITVDLANPTVDLTAVGLGIDTLISIEGLRTGDFNDMLFGQNNVDNELDGRAGADTMDGRSGNDRVRYDASPAAVTVNLATGTASDGFGSTDSLVSIENVRGSRFNDTITGSSANNAIEGFLGADSMNGGAGTGDTLEFRFSPGAIVVDLSLAAAQVVKEDGWGFADKSAANFENVIGGAGDDSINGSDLANRLDGNVGADTLAGGLGNDTLVVDNEGDVISDTGGTADTVESLIDFSLASVTGFENLTLLDPAASSLVNPVGVAPAIRATGGTGKNIIIGNSAGNIIDGGAGNDDMRGGKGNDTYVVAQALDLVKENANEGTDTVKASVSFSLGANVENLILTGSADNDGTGNDRPNSIKGNAGINALDGGAGNDTLVGGAGADELSGGAGTDQFIWDPADTLVDGGAGSQDRLIVQGAGKTLNLDTLVGTVINGIEVFDIHGTGNNTLNVSAATAESMGDWLTVFGNTGDKVNLNGAGTWTQDPTNVSYQGHIFHFWTNDLNDTAIMIETAITVTDAA